MRVTAFGLVLLLMAVPVAAGAEEGWQPACSGMNSQSDINACMADAVVALEDELDAVLARIAASSPDEQAQELLQDSQALWRQQVEADIAALFPLAPGEDARFEYGSSYPASRMMVEGFLIDQRLHFLKTFWKKRPR